MALSFATVQQAYTVLNQLKKVALPELNICSWPDDMAKWPWHQKEDPPKNVLLGWDRKSDDGWENLVFFVDNPSKELKAAFKKLNTIKSNSSICKPNKTGSSVWIFGWF